MVYRFVGAEQQVETLSDRGGPTNVVGQRQVGADVVPVAPPVLLLDQRTVGDQ